MSVCNCNEFTLGNMGAPNCVPIAGQASRIILGKYFKSGGTIQGVTTSETFTQVTWDAHLQRYDSTGTLVTSDNRWYLSPELENVEDLRADTVFQEFNSGRKARVRDGVRTMTLYIPKGTPELLKQIVKFQCEDMGFYIVDTNGNLIGNGGTSGVLNMIQIAKGSFDAKLIKTTDSEVPMIMITFDIGTYELDEDLKMFLASDMVVKISSLKALYNVIGTLVGSPTTSTFTMKFLTDYGSVLNPVAVGGLVVGDFVLTEVTPTPGTVTITSVVESSTVAGQYAFTFTTATSGDILKLTLKRNGLDGAQIETIEIEAP